jgi:hypothetical protein
MPRHDWNRPQAHTQTPKHRRMKSGAKGKGHDHYIRAAKQRVSQSKADSWKADLRRREKEREERDGTVGTTLQRYTKRLDPGMPGGSVSAQLDRVRIKTS